MKVQDTFTREEHKKAIDALLEGKYPPDGGLKNPVIKDNKAIMIPEQVAMIREMLIQMHILL